MQKQVEKSHASKYNKDFGKEATPAPNNTASNMSNKESEGGFAAVLGLPTITVETLYH